MTTPEDLYEILQVHPSAHQEVVDAAYQRLAQLYHPAADPSPEAAAMLGAIGRAYAVLGNPEQRTAYDQSQETPTAGAADQDESRSWRGISKSNPDYFTIGSHKEDVTRIQGPPDSTNFDEHRDEETWTYSGGIVYFNRSGRVVGWSIFDGSSLEFFKVTIVPGLNATTSDFFSVGSHKDDVFRLQGTPYRLTTPSQKTLAATQEEPGYRHLWRRELRRMIDYEHPKYYELIEEYDVGEDPDLETWHFPNGVVELSIATGRVTAWQNRDGSLKAQRRCVKQDAQQTWTGEYFTLGSNSATVVRVQGDPVYKERRHSGTEIWHYEHDSKVELKRGRFSGWRVLGWSSYSGNLKVRVGPGPNVTSRHIFSLGSHKDDVARLQGTPQSINTYMDVCEAWHYSSASVYFSYANRVTDWDNPEGVLKAEGIRPDFTDAKRLAEKIRGQSSGQPAAQGCFSLLAALLLFALVASVPAFFV